VANLELYHCSMGSESSSNKWISYISRWHGSYWIVLVSLVTRFRCFDLAAWASNVWLPNQIAVSAANFLSGEASKCYKGATVQQRIVVNCN